MAPDHSTVDPASRKSVLFCRACGHANPVDGDWHVGRTPGGVLVYRCPDCDHVLARRPAPTGNGRDHGDDPLSPRTLRGTPVDPAAWLALWSAALQRLPWRADGRAGAER